MGNTKQRRENSIFYTITKWFYLSIDAFFSITAIYSILKAEFGLSNESCGAATLIHYYFSCCCCFKLNSTNSSIIQK
ncbi:MAG: hypothetical protein ACTSVB_07175 [Candidatus Heimdallarchaeaceae archaeon]|uniref:Uncharacterized protein n=1 Tax=Candidatus Heimdallarchaeum endolithica TaxID=2876572 RepID=A0A9Y1BRH0_9ARCH|nr:MAG: hypothetical protein K9W46_01755 [Candidatus Heimdallarchaeum endolithica]